MARFIFDLAKRSDEPQLRRIVESDPMDGDIRVSYLRHPDIFHSFDVLGESSQIVVARDASEDVIAGLGIRSIRPMCVNGKFTNVGYLSGLRIVSEYRGGTLLARSFKFLKELHQADGHVRLYLATIIEKNQRALRALSNGRAGLPEFNDFGGIRTFGVAVGKRFPRNTRDKWIEIGRGSYGNIGAIVRFVNETRRARQFAPYISIDQIGNRSDLYRGLGSGDFFVAYRDGRIIGVVAKWDQQSFKRNVIAGYGRRLRLMRPAYNTWARLAGRAVLPEVGRTIRTCYVACVAIAGNDPNVLGQLLEAVRTESSSQGYSHMLVGLHEKDSLVPVLMQMRPIEYRSRLMVVHWPDGKGAFEELQDSVPLVEIAML